MKFKAISGLILGLVSSLIIARLTHADKRLGVNAFVLGPAAYLGVVALTTSIDLYLLRLYRNWKHPQESGK